MERALRGTFERLRPPGLVAGYLFGSHAAGSAHRESDVDVDRDFRRDTLLRAADLQPFLEGMRAVKSTALAR
jgi:predicted nucleotidyltransferase